MWIFIVMGVIVVPIISTYTKELETQLDNEASVDIKFLFWKIRTKEDAQTLNRVLSATVLILIIATAATIAIFTRESIQQ